MISFKKQRSQSVFLLIVLIGLLFQNCDPDSYPNKGRPLYKPNVYIYPETKINLSVNIDFPIGGEIITSIPEYGTGWMINVDENGLIDSTYTYLFYESTQPDIWQNKIGWNVIQGELESFFELNMKNYGFIESEIKDFTEYWIPKLKQYNSYNIYPQTNEIIEQAVLLNFSEKPDNMLRLYYLIEGCNEKNIRIAEPEIETFQRTGFVVTEWGVVL